jgi:hypothetical protein
MARAVAIAFFGVVLFTLPATASGPQHADDGATASETQHADDDAALAPLDRLERVRRDPKASSDPAVIEALARDADTFSAGTVRAEARMLVAEAWLGRMHRREDAIAELRKVSDDPEAEPITARLAERELVDALVKSGRLDEASAETQAHASRLDRGFVARMQRLVRRRTWTRVALLDLATLILLPIVAILRARHRRTFAEVIGSTARLAPLAVGVTAYVAGIGGALASQYETGNAAPFVALGIAVLPLVLVARAWSSAGSTRPSARAGRALWCATSVFAAAFLVLDVAYPTYLEGFGL